MGNRSIRVSYRAWGRLAFVCIGAIGFVICLYMWYAWSTISVGGRGEGLGFVRKRALQCARQWQRPQLEEVDVIMTPRCDDAGIQKDRVFWVKSLKERKQVDGMVITYLDRRLCKAKYWIVGTIVPVIMIAAGVIMLTYSSGDKRH